MWEFVDKVVYINLDRREDRRQIMKEFFEKGQIPEEKIYRFSAIKDPIGFIGCAKSHIGVLKLAKQNKWKSVLILEDDLEWIDFANTYNKLEDLIKIETWDVCMLTGLYFITNPPYIKFAFYTNAYIVKEYYYDTLIQNMEYGLSKKQDVMIERSKHMLSFRRKYNHPLYEHLYNVDVYWTKLQQRDNWIGCLDPPICQQKATYSDINNEVIAPLWKYVPGNNSRLNETLQFIISHN